MKRVSEHVYDLALMDNIKINDGDFYPAMIMREVILRLWRIVWLSLVILLPYYLNINTTTILKLILSFLWFLFISISWSIYLREKNEQHL
jgi:hypothetical protein